MKILYVITKSNWGGAQRHLFDLAVASKASGHTAIVALGGDGTLRQKLEDAGIKTHTINTLDRDISIKKELASLRILFNIVKRESPDILHLHSPKASGLGALVGKILRVKRIIVTIHGWTFNEDRPFWQRLLIVILSWFTLLLSHKTILLSEKEYTQALHFPWIKDRLSLIPLGIKQPIFLSIDGAKMEFSKKIGLGINEISKRIVVGTVTEFVKNKGIFYLINAIEIVTKQYPNILCILIGDGDDLSSTHILIKEKKLENSIFLTGYMDHAVEYIKAFNIFVLPSIKEGLPYVVLEAASAGLPVVATTVGGIPEIVEDMKSGVLVQPKNPKELAHAISFMIDHPQMRREYGAVLRTTTALNFSFDKMIEKVLELYTH